MSNKKKITSFSSGTLKLEYNMFFYIWLNINSKTILHGFWYGIGLFYVSKIDGLFLGGPKKSLILFSQSKKN